MAKKHWRAIVGKFGGVSLRSPMGTYYCFSDSYGSGPLARRIARLLNADDAAKAKRRKRVTP